MAPFTVREDTATPFAVTAMYPQLTSQATALITSRDPTSTLTILSPQRSLLSASTVRARPGELFIEGSPSDVVTALRSLSYLPPPDFVGTDVVTVLLKDSNAPSCMLVLCRFFV